MISSIGLQLSIIGMSVVFLLLLLLILIMYLFKVIIKDETDEGSEMPLVEGTDPSSGVEVPDSVVESGDQLSRNQKIALAISAAIASYLRDEGPMEVKNDDASSIWRTAGRMEAMRLRGDRG